jgi:hypothetical protein
MNKRTVFGAIAAVALAPLMIGRSEAAGRGGPSATFTVPRGVKKIRVRSFRDGKKVIDTSLNVQPGQTFTIDTV